MLPPPPPPMPPMPPVNGPHFVEANGGNAQYNTYDTKPTSHSYIVTMNVINTLTHLALGAVVMSAFIIASVLNTAAPWLLSAAYPQHVYLCVTGYVILMSQAVLTLNPHAGWASTLKYPDKKLVHWVMQVLGSILAITGAIVKLTDGVNLDSVHGITGFVATILTGLSLLGGLVNLVFPNQANTRLYSTCHGCLGSLTLTIAFIALCIAFSDVRVTDNSAIIAIGATVVALVGLLIASLTRIYNRWVD